MGLKKAIDIAGQVATEAPKKQVSVYKAADYFTIRTDRGARAAPHPQNQLPTKNKFFAHSRFP